jgi:hypothetical protein
MQPWNTALLLFGIAAVALAQKPGGPSPEPPPPAPLALEVVGKGEAVLDRGGRTADEFRADIAAGRLTPTPLSCALSLRITNNTKAPIRIRPSSWMNHVALDLEGKALTREFTGTSSRPPTAIVVLKPRESWTLSLSQLAGYKKRDLAYRVPMEAGEYRLKASLRLYVFPDDLTGMAVKGKAKPGELVTGWIDLTAPPFKLKVKEK